MTYDEPVVTAVASTLEAVQHPTVKLQLSLVDWIQFPQFSYITTINAYEADE